jgi:hypothetical protein
MKYSGFWHSRARKRVSTHFKFCDVALIGNLNFYAAEERRFSIRVTERAGFLAIKSSWP